MFRLSRFCVLFLAAAAFCPWQAYGAEAPFPGERGVQLDLACRDDIWEHKPKGYLQEFVRVPRDEVVAFALYTHDHGVLKLSAHLYPLMPDETREVRLEFKRGDAWAEAARAEVIYPGWSANFRIAPWDNTKDVPYRVRHGKDAVFEGLIRKDPIGKDVITVASLSCDSNSDRGDRDNIVENIKKQDPDLLFFAGDQSYDHKEHTAGFLLWGKHFAELIKDRPVVSIPDDHDVGQGNLWGRGRHRGGRDGRQFRRLFLSARVHPHGGTAARRGTCRTRRVPRRLARGF